MITELLAKELAKLAAQKLSEVKVDDAARAIRTLRHAAGGAALVPGLGVFGILGLGLVIGAGVGVMLAPRSGKETREALRDATRQRIAQLRSKFGASCGAGQRRSRSSGSQSARGRRIARRELKI